MTSPQLPPIPPNLQDLINTPADDWTPETTAAIAEGLSLLKARIEAAQSQGSRKLIRTKSIPTTPETSK